MVYAEFRGIKPAMIERCNEFQNTIQQLSGVINANVILNEGQLSEIHILSNQVRHPKQISRDVQSIYAAKYGEVIDRKLISIAQIDVELPTDTLAELDRIQLEEVKYQIDNDAQAQVRVSLKHSEGTYLGKSFGVNTSRNAKRLVIEATLQSLGALFGSNQRIVLEDFKSVKLAGVEVINVVLCAINDFSEEAHVGSAIVRGDEKEALVRATLDALNRRISKLVK